jgi:hypothetical protein
MLGLGGHHLAYRRVVRVERRCHFLANETAGAADDQHRRDRHGTLSSCHLADEFNVAVTGGGTLVVRLRWDTVNTTTVSLVSIDGVEFRSGPPDWAPSSPRWPRPRGQQYRLRVALQGSEEIPEDHYQLTTTLE